MIWGKNNSTRNSAFAGRFYSSNPVQLIEEMKTYTNTYSDKEPVLGIISPHASFIYSGEVAGSVYSAIKVPDTIILLGPNHTGNGPTASIMPKGCWKMPFGTVEIEEKLAQILINRIPAIKIDIQAHLKEHSLETQLPFIQFFRNNFKIVPICFQRIEFNQSKQIGQAIADSIKEYSKEVLIVASSDMSHFKSHENTIKIDHSVINHILDLDPKGLYKKVREEKINMCGIIPAVCMLTACIKLGSKQARLIQYKTSGEVNGDMDRVVGYASVTIK